MHSSNHTFCFLFSSQTHSVQEEKGKEWGEEGNVLNYKKLQQFQQKRGKCMRHCQHLSNSKKEIPLILKITQSERTAPGPGFIQQRIKEQRTQRGTRAIWTTASLHTVVRPAYYARRPQLAIQSKEGSAYGVPMRLDNHALPKENNPSLQAFFKLTQYEKNIYSYLRISV